MDNIGLFTLLLQIITIFISLLSLVITIFQQRNENKKQHFLEIVTKERIEELHIVRINSAEFLALTYPAVLEGIDDDELLKLIYQLCLKVENIKSIFKDIYEEEREIKEICLEIIDKLYQYLSNKDNKPLQKLFELREKFAYKMSVYDHANWNFIIHQSDGQYAGNDSFMKYYKKSINQFQNK